MPKTKTFTTTIRCNCSPDGKGCGLRNMSGHRETCPAHVAFVKAQKAKAPSTTRSATSAKKR